MGEKGKRRCGREGIFRKMEKQSGKRNEGRLHSPFPLFLYIWNMSMVSIVASHGNPEYELKTPFINPIWASSIGYMFSST